MCVSSAQLLSLRVHLCMDCMDADTEGAWWQLEEEGLYLTLHNLSLGTTAVISCNVSNNWGYLILNHYLTVHGAP